MASEAVKKILAAENESAKRTSDARKRRDELIENAMGNSAIIIQKKLGEATKESNRIRSEYDRKLSEYTKNAESDYDHKLAELRSMSERNMDKAVDEIIAKFF